MLSLRAQEAILVDKLLGGVYYYQLIALSGTNRLVTYTNDDGVFATSSLRVLKHRRGDVRFPRSLDAPLLTTLTLITVMVECNYG